jgi:hypothetical protein
MEIPGQISAEIDSHRRLAPSWKLRIRTPMP